MIFKTFYLVMPNTYITFDISLTGNKQGVNY